VAELGPSPFDLEHHGPSLETRRIRNRVVSGPAGNDLSVRAAGPYKSLVPLALLRKEGARGCWVASSKLILDRPQKTPTGCLGVTGFGVFSRRNETTIRPSGCGPAPRSPRERPKNSPRGPDFGRTETPWSEGVVSDGGSSNRHDGSNWPTPTFRPSVGKPFKKNS